MEGIESSGLGDDEKNYRREQTIFWLIRAAERGSKERIKIALYIKQFFSFKSSPYKFK